MSAGNKFFKNGVATKAGSKKAVGDDPYRILPPHSSSERNAIYESIKANGLESPLILDEYGNIIDGHLRRDICEELGIDWHVGAIVRIGLTDAEKKAMAVALNLARRSTPPTSKQRREYAEALLTANPEQSDASIAAVVGLDDTTIFKYRRDLLKNRKLQPVTHTVGIDGRRRKVSSEARKSSNQKRASFQVKSKKEYDKIAPAARELTGSPRMTNGIIRRPNRLPALLRRQKALESLEQSTNTPLPSDIDIRHCDFRKLKIKHGTVDLICTDVVWGKNSQQDWADLAKLAKTWLKEDGVFATFIGSFHIHLLIEAVAPHLFWRRPFYAPFAAPSLCVLDNCTERMRLIAVFSKSSKHSFQQVSDTIDRSHAEKTYDDWQQPLPVTKELVRRLCPREGIPTLVVDPHLGTGTTAVACAQLAGKSFIGCDIDPKKIKIARHRIATECKPLTA